MNLFGPILTRISALYEKAEDEGNAGEKFGISIDVMNALKDGLYCKEINTFFTGSNESIVELHLQTPECEEYGCVIHAQSNHSMRGMRTHWREDRGLMERICKHGIGHPDPDDIAYKRRCFGNDFADAESVHGCCRSGCCR